MVWYGMSQYDTVMYGHVIRRGGRILSGLSVSVGHDRCSYHSVYYLCILCILCILYTVNVEDSCIQSTDIGPKRTSYRSVAVR